MPEAVIVATARTPIGRAYKGSLIDVRADDLCCWLTFHRPNATHRASPAKLLKKESCIANYADISYRYTTRHDTHLVYCRVIRPTIVIYEAGGGFKGINKYHDPSLF